MTRAETRIQHLSNTLVILSGILLALTKYFPGWFQKSAAADPYSKIANPYEPWCYDAHVLLAPLLVFALGVILRTHILPKWRAVMSAPHPKKKWSGVSLTAVAVPMILTGYFMQVAVEDTTRSVLVWVHLGASAIWTIAYLIHLSLKAS